MLPSLLPVRLVSNETDYREGLNEEEEEEFELLVQTYIKDMHYTSVNQAALNITYSMINVGLVGIPFVAYQAGIPLFSLFIFVFSIISVYTTSIVLEMADDVKARSLEELGEKAFVGPSGYIVTCIIQILFSMLLMCITLDVWGDIMPQLLKNMIGSSLEDHTPLYHFLTHRRPVIILGVIIILPLCFVRSMSKLSWLSYLTVCALLMSVVFVLVALFDGDTCSGSDICHIDEVYEPRRLWWTVQPLLTFCFTYQQKLFFVYNCLRRRTVPRIRSAITASHCFVGLMYLVFGILAALNYVPNAEADDDKSQITLNYFAKYGTVHGPQLVYDIARGIVAFSLLYTLPVDCLVAVTTWRRLRKRYIRYIKNRVWEQDAYDIQPDSFQAYRKRSDDAADELNGLLSGEERKNNSIGLTHRRQQSKTLIDEDDVICVEMMRRGGCLSAKDSSFSQHSSSEDHRNTLPNSKIGDHRTSNDAFLKSKPSGTASTATSFGTTSFLSSLDPARNSFINGSHPNEYLGSIPSPAPTGRSEMKVSFQQQDLDRDTGLSRVSEYSDDMSSARTIAWNRPTFESQQQQNQIEQSEIDDQSVEGMNQAYLDDDDEDYLENGSRYPSQKMVPRRSSIGQIHERRRTVPEYINHGVYVLILLVLILTLTTLIKSWIIWASFMGSILTSIFAFILPSMLYFRLGLRSDFRSIPLVGSMIPNRLIMLCLQIFGILCILGNLVGFVWFDVSKNFSL